MPSKVPLSRRRRAVCPQNCDQRSSERAAKWRQKLWRKYDASKAPIKAFHERKGKKKEEYRDDDMFVVSIKPGDRISANTLHVNTQRWGRKGHITHSSPSSDPVFKTDSRQSNTEEPEAWSAHIFLFLWENKKHSLHLWLLQDFPLKESICSRLFLGDKIIDRSYLQLVSVVFIF